MNLSQNINQFIESVFRNRGIKPPFFDSYKSILKSIKNYLGCVDGDTHIHEYDTVLGNLMNMITYTNSNDIIVTQKSDLANDHIRQNIESFLCNNENIQIFTNIHNIIIDGNVWFFVFCLNIESENNIEIERYAKLVVQVLTKSPFNVIYNLVKSMGNNPDEIKIKFGFAYMNYPHNYEVIVFGNSGIFEGRLTFPKSGNYNSLANYSKYEVVKSLPSFVLKHMMSNEQTKLNNLVQICNNRGATELACRNYIMDNNNSKTVVIIVYNIACVKSLLTPDEQLVFAVYMLNRMASSIIVEARYLDTLKFLEHVKTPTHPLNRIMYKTKICVGEDKYSFLLDVKISNAVNQMTILIKNHIAMILRRLRAEFIDGINDHFLGNVGNRKELEFVVRCLLPDTVLTFRAYYDSVTNSVLVDTSDIDADMYHDDIMPTENVFDEQHTINNSYQEVVPDTDADTNTDTNTDTKAMPNFKLPEFKIPEFVMPKFNFE